VADVAASIGPGLAKAALAARVNGEVRDITRPFEGDVEQFCSAILENVTQGRTSRTFTESADGRAFEMRVRIDTPFERQVFRAGGILPFTLRAML